MFFLRWFERLLDLTVVAGIVCISGLVFWQFVSRYAFSASLSWSEEVATFVMIWAGLFGVASLLRDGDLIAIDTVQRLQVRALRVAARLVALAATIAFLALLLVLGLEMSVFSSSTGVTSAAQIPLRWLYLIFPMTSAIMILRLIVRGWTKRQDLFA